MGLFGTLFIIIMHLYLCQADKSVTTCNPLPEIVAIDDKTLRRSYDTKTSKSAIHMISAWASSSSLVLGQRKVSEKSNEITAIPELLKVLELKGCIVTIDAMGCQKEIVSAIAEKEADYVIAVKKINPHYMITFKIFLLKQLQI